MPIVSKAESTEAGDTVVINIPPRRTRSETLYLFLGLTLGIDGVLLAMQRSANPRGMSWGVILAYFIVGSIIMVSCLVILLYQFFGGEVIILGPDKLTIRRQTFGIGITSKFDFTRITNLKVHHEKFPDYFNREKDRKTPVYDRYTRICFDYGQDSRCFGASLSEEDQAALIIKLKEHFNVRTD